MVERSDFTGERPFPGMEKLQIPPTPANKDTKEMLVAHRIDDTVRAVGHGSERMSAALATSDPSLRGYHSIHIANHLAVALNNMHFLLEDLRLHYPAEWSELQALKQCVGLARSLDRKTRVATFAHLTETVLHELTHAKRHADEMLRPEPRLVWDFNADHARKHLKGAQEHIDKLSEHVFDNYPGEARWLQLLKRLQDGHLATDEPAWKALKLSRPLDLGGARYRATDSEARNCHTCEYSTGWSDVTRLGMCTMFSAGISRGHTCDEWEGKKVGLAVPATSSPAPGPRDQYGLHQVPSQTAAASPVLPPGAKVPTPREVRALIKLVPDGMDPSLSTGTRKALETAAVKLEKKDVIEALAALRTAQSSLYSASRKDAGLGLPAIYGPKNVFGPGMVPPAAQGSALESMRRAYLEQSGAWRKIGTEVALMIERIRRHWFHGTVNGYSPNLRV